MSGGYYRLLRTDSQDDDDDENDRQRPVSASAWTATATAPTAPSGAHALLSRIYSTFLISSHPSKKTRRPLLPSSLGRRPSRDSSSSCSSSIFTSPKFRRSQSKCILGSLALGALFFVLTVFGAWHYDSVHAYYWGHYLQSPSLACLKDPKSPTSYVHYSPRSGRWGTIYHCITQKSPQQPSPSPYFNSTALQRDHGRGQYLRPYRPLPAWCIDAYYTNGTACNDAQRTMFDVIWTWVNGSDPLIARARSKALWALNNPTADEGEWEFDDQEEEDEGSAHLYRDHDELRHSLRSVLQYFRESVNKFVIVTSDFDFPITYSPLKYLLGLSKRDAITAPEHKRGNDQPLSNTRRRRSLKHKMVDEYYDGDGLEEEGDEEEDPYAFARLGLLPQWLKFNVAPEELENDGTGRYDADKRTQGIGRWRDGNIPLEVVHHSELYDEYDGTMFNSNSIEGQLPNLSGNKAFVYLNDDYFFAAPLSSSDFHTSEYGLVFRLIAYPFMLVSPHHYSTESPIGEWAPMEYTNYLISERFGIRRRPYPMHQVKTFQGGLMREMWAIWDAQEGFNRAHKFRGMGGLNTLYGNHSWADEIDPLTDPDEVEKRDEEDARMLKKRNKRSVELFERAEEVSPSESATVEEIKPKQVDPDDEEPDFGTSSTSPEDGGDANIAFLFIHFVVERSREGMLWSWIVATLGGDNDEFGIGQTNEAWRVLTEEAGAEQRGGGVLQVEVGMRKTMEPWRIQWALDQVGDTLKAAQYRFSSQDGYPYSYYDDQHGFEWWHDGSTYWPLLWRGDNFPENVADRPAWSTCTIDWNQCFPSDLTSASDVFKHIAFQRTECGDCILKALVRASGDLGLKALLPPPDRVYRRYSSSASPRPVPVGEDDIGPHLPLDSDYRKADFSLAGVFASGYWGREEGGVQLRDWIQRMLERYRYVIADTDNYFNVVHDPVDAERLFAYVDDHPNVAFVTVNDDVNQYPEKTDARMRAWFDQRWPTPAEWEDPYFEEKTPPPFDWLGVKRDEQEKSRRRLR